MTVRKSALWTVAECDGVTRSLWVRGRNNPSELVLPGGKREGAESALDALHREIREELMASVIDPVVLVQFVGRTSSHQELEVTVFGGRLDAAVRPSSEIIETCWLSLDELCASDRRAMLTPITREQIIPWIVAQTAS